MLLDMFTIGVRSGVGIEALSVAIAMSINALGDMFADMITSVVPDVSVGVLADVSSNRLAAVMTALERITSASSEESFIFG